MPKKQDYDLSNWALVDTFTVHQAACLWVGVDPSKQSSDRTRLEISRVTPILEMLSTAIQDHNLHVDSSRDLFASRGDFAGSRVTRNDLKAFAEGKGERPAFLFDTSFLKTEIEEAPLRDPKNPNASAVGRPSACPRELWLERFVLLVLQGKVSLEDSQDSIATALSEDLKKLGIEIKPATIKKDWIGPIIRKAKDESN